MRLPLNTWPLSIRQLGRKGVHKIIPSTVRCPPSTVLSVRPPVRPSVQLPLLSKLSQLSAVVWSKSVWLYPKPAHDPRSCARLSQLQFKVFSFSFRFSLQLCGCGLLSHGPDFKIGHIQWPVSWHFYARKMSTSLQNATYSTLQPASLHPSFLFPPSTLLLPKSPVQVLDVRRRFGDPWNVLFTTTSTSLVAAKESR